jgi:hypothetical protein
MGASRWIWTESLRLGLSILWILPPPLISCSLLDFDFDSWDLMWVSDCMYATITCLHEIRVIWPTVSTTTQEQHSTSRNFPNFGRMATTILYV